MNFVQIIKEVLSSWSSHKFSTWAAALAYYTLFSLTPILLVSLNLLVFFLNEELVRNSILSQINELMGTEVSNQIQLMIKNASKPVLGIKAQLLSWILLFIGSSAIFTEIQSGLNNIWGVKTNPQKPWMLTLIKNRLLSFIMVLVVAFSLLISFALSISLTAMAGYLSKIFNIGIFEIIFLHVSSFFIGVLLFAMIFKILPDVMIKWRDVWIGAIITTILFTLGKYILGIYFSHLQSISMYGAAGSLIILLIWMYYSAQIFFIGAEITKVLAYKRRRTIQPKCHSVFLRTKIR